MENPFQLINERLANIEDLLLTIKHEKPQPESIQPQEDEEQFVTKKEAAKLLSLSTSAVDNYARSGKLTRHYFGKSVRFKRAEVLQLFSGTSYSAEAAKERIKKRTRKK